jgi:two-component system cell cycle response regulator DivK
MAHALIVDDNPSNIRVLEMLLEKESVTFSGVASPDQIDDALVGGPPVDIVFLDLAFPDQSAMDLLPILRQHPALVNAQIVAYSVHTSEIDAVRRAGFDGFLGKPLDAYDFPGHLRRLLDGESVWAV